MNDAQYHLLINHFPIIGMIIGTLILLAGIIFQSTVTRRVAFTVLLFAGLSALPTFESGGGAAGIVKQMPGADEASEGLIRDHAEKAKFFMPFAWGIIALSLISLFVEWKKQTIAMYTSILTLIVAVLASYFAKEAGASGGHISHPETHKDFKVPEGNDEK